MTWQFSTADLATIKRWGSKDTRDSRRSLFWYPLMFADGSGGLRLQKSGMLPSSKWKGVIRTYSEFQVMEGGDMIRLKHVPKLAGRGTHGDAQLAGATLSTGLLTQDMYLDYFATQVASSGPLSDQRVGMDFIDTWRPELAAWYAMKWEEAITIALWGLTTWYGTPFDNWDNTNGEATIFNSTVETFDTDAITYAGDATSDATIDAGDVLTAQLLTKIRTDIRETRTFPVEPLTNEKEQDCFGFVTSGRGIEQLMADQEFRDNHTKVVPNGDNPLTKRAGFFYNGFYIMEYERCPRVSENVGRSLVVGADALLAAEHKGIEYFTDPADHAKRRVALSVTGSGGVKAHKPAPVTGTARRRNCHAVDHYVRS